METLSKEDKRREVMRNLNRKRKMQILKATNNGRCWWLYQQLIANPKKYRTSE